MFKRLREAIPRLFTQDRRIDEVKINQGLLLTHLNSTRRLPELCGYEFKVFSQWGEDGILQHLTQHLDIPNRTFIEFGVEDFFESNCRFLMVKDNWEGFVIDGSEAHMERLRSSYFYWRYRLTAKASFITRDNVAALLDESGFDKSLGILSVDVDGVDWHLLNALPMWRPCIVIVEYNAIFGPDRAVTVPYDASFQRSKAHPSNLYYGASLQAFAQLMGPRGYDLVGVNSVGSNAFFVRRDLINERVPVVDASTAFRPSTFREARNDQGALTFKTARDSWALIGHLPLEDTSTGQSLTVRQLYEAP
jgi:hypothetical protein